MPLLRQRLRRSRHCRVPGLPATPPASLATRRSSSERDSEALSGTRRPARDSRSNAVQACSRQARRLGSSCRGGTPVRPRSRWRAHQGGAAKSSSWDGNTGLPSRANHASSRACSAREVDWLDRSRLIDDPSPPTPPGELGERSWLTHSQGARRQRNSVDPSEKPGLIVVDLAGDEDWARFAQLLDELAHRPVPRRTQLSETLSAQLIASPH